MKLQGESYAHAAARGVLARWLRQWAKEHGDAVSAFGGAVYWRVNRGEPTMGVYEEYPLASCHPEYSLLGHMHDVLTNWDERLHEDDDCPPTVDWCWMRGYEVKAVLDVAISHKGMIRYGFEVVHKHGLTPLKREYLRLLNNLIVFVVPAHWILGQIERPTKLIYDEVINPYPTYKPPQSTKEPKSLKQLLQGWDGD